MPRFELTVECYAGHRSEEEPRRLVFGARGVSVREIVDRWHGPDHRYFKLRGEDEALYIVRHDEVTGLWEMTFYDARE